MNSKKENLYLYTKTLHLGNIESLFISNDSEIEKCLNRNVYFGEILGKHSEICVKLKLEDIKKIKIPKETIEILKQQFGNTISGHNPIQTALEQMERNEIYEDHFL